MSTFAKLRVLALGCLVATTACATTQTTGEKIDDTQIRNRVGRALTADAETSRLEIDVDAVDGVVTLTGEVDSDAEKAEAEKIARGTEGVRDVRNLLQVEGQTPESDRTDIGIRTSIAAKLLRDPQVARYEIDIDVENGVVVLTGVVHDEDARKEAENIARHVDGVQDVRNQLQVSPKDDAFRKDSEVQKQGEPGTNPDGTMGTTTPPPR